MKMVPLSDASLSQSASDVLSYVDSLVWLQEIHVSSSPEFHPQ